MSILNIAVLLFAPFLIFGAFALTLMAADPLVGEPWSAIAATAAYIIALKFVSDAP